MFGLGVVREIGGLDNGVWGFGGADFGSHPLAREVAEGGQRRGEGGHPAESKDPQSLFLSRPKT